eukprot:5036621-Amphidinium_carterae.1
MAYVGSPSSHGIEPTATDWPFVPIGWTTYYQQDGKETSNPAWGDHFPPDGSFNHCYACVQHSDDSFVRIGDGPHWCKSGVKAVKS